MTVTAAQKVESVTVLRAFVGVPVGVTVEVKPTTEAGITVEKRVRSAMV